MWTVPKIWDDSVCFILGGGPSLLDQFDIPRGVKEDIKAMNIRPNVASQYMDNIKGYHIIGVNNSYQFGDWVDVLFFGDSSWYLWHRHQIADWPGLKVSCAPRFKNEKLGIKYVPKSHKKRMGLTENPRELSWNYNSGATAINLAYHLGARAIVLLGFDMKRDKDGTSHYHGLHKQQPVKQIGKKGKRVTYRRHLKGFPQIAKDAKKLGLRIINASPDSAIQEFPRMTLNDALGEL